MAHSPLLVAELDRRAGASSCRQAASDLGIPRPRLVQLRQGGSIGPRSAVSILDKIREEDLALADRIEAELLSSWGFRTFGEAGR